MKTCPSINISLANPESTQSHCSPLTEKNVQIFDQFWGEPKRENGDVIEKPEIPRPTTLKSSRFLNLCVDSTSSTYSRSPCNSKSAVGLNMTNYYQIPLPSSPLPPEIRIVEFLKKNEVIVSHPSMKKKESSKTLEFKTNTPLAMKSPSRIMRARPSSVWSSL